LWEEGKGDLSAIQIPGCVSDCDFLIAETMSETTLVEAEDVMKRVIRREEDVSKRRQSESI
jgi:hypothetical protein